MTAYFKNLLKNKEILWLSRLNQNAVFFKQKKLILE